jgi:hypothetical protein
MKTYTLELSFEELKELYSTLYVRKLDLETDIKKETPASAGIAARQLAKTLPVLKRLESLFPII